MKKRNIRQIGQIKGIRNIYIEDYAMSYLKQMAEPDVPYARMAVLVGEQEKGTKEEAVYVYGVLDIPSGGEGVGYQMDSAAWTRLYAEMGQHFPQMEIVGWYLTGEELIPEKNEWLIRFHRENFAGDNKIFFYYNPTELEEIGYFYEEGQLKPQSGYYIFYEKNEAMQNLLVTKHQEETGWRQPGTWRERMEWSEGREERKEREEKNIYGYRQASYEERDRREESFQDRTQPLEIRREEKQNRNGGRASSYLAGMATAVAVLALCLVGLQYFERLDGLEESIRQLTGNLSEVSTMGQAQTAEGEREEGGEEEEGKDGKEKEGESKNTEDKGNGKEEEKEKEEEGKIGNIENGEKDIETDEEKTNKEGQAGAEEGGSVLEVETLPGGIVANPEKTGQNEAGKEEKDEGKQTGTEETEEDETEGIEPADDTVSGSDGSEQTGERTVAARSQNRYIVQAGDTLSAICQAFYEDLSMLDTLMQVNQLSDPNGILEGDVLILP